MTEGMGRHPKRHEAGKASNRTGTAGGERREQGGDAGAEAAKTTASMVRQAWKDKAGLRGGNILMPDNMMFLLNLAAAIMTIMAFITACVQIGIGNWQFTASGPAYSWFPLNDDQVSLDGTGRGGKPEARVLYGGVVSNTGRTGGTVVAVTDPDGRSDAMIVCLPVLDGKGNLESVSMDTAFRLEPGESRFVILLSRSVDPDKENRFHVDYSEPERLVVHGADGTSLQARELTHVDAGIIRHYLGLPSYGKAGPACLDLAKGKGGAK